MDIPEDNSVTSTCQFSLLPTYNYEDNTEYEMIYTSGVNLWDFWLSELEQAKYLEGWKIRIRNKILSNELKEMEVAKSDELAIILLPSGSAARAKIIAEASRDDFGAYNVSILDVDTGEMMTTYVENLYIPDKELMERKPLAVNCCLNVDRNNYKERFLKCVRSGPLKVVFKRVTLSSPPKFVVDVHVKRKGVNINLVDFLGFDSTMQNPKAATNSGNGGCNEGELFRYQASKLGKKTISDEKEVMNDIHVSHVDSISKFYVWESMDCIKQLKSLMVELKSCYKSTTIKVPDVFIKSLSNGYACAAFDTKELNWCRGEVLRQTKNIDFKGLVQKHYEVLLVDFGNRIEVPVSLIRPLNPKFYKFPVFAKRCHLFGLKPASGFRSPDGLDYSKDVIEIFDMFLDSGKLTLIEASTRPDDPPNSIPVIVERHYKGNDYVINLELLAQKLVSSPVFDVDVCNDILKQASEKNIHRLSLDLKTPNGNEVFKRETEPRNGKSIGNEALKRETEPRNRKYIDSRSISRTSEPIQSDSPEQEFKDWNPMQEDYTKAAITYDNVVDDDASALIGYQAKDEERICKFFAQSGQCYKGAACRKEHSHIRPDGWTTDCHLVYGSTFSYLCLPKSGTQIRLEIMIVTDICKFYAKLQDAWLYKETSHGFIPNEKCKEDTIENLIVLINSKENVAKLRRLTMPPGVGEIVLCKLPSLNLFYRAQVLDTNLEENLFLVLYVDVGFTDWIGVSNIRQIENHYLHLPFQAVDCELAYYGAPKNIDGVKKMEIMRTLSSIISLKKLTAYVVRSFTPINKMIVELFDENGVSIGEVLKKNGYLIETPDIYDAEIKVIPG